MRTCVTVRGNSGQYLGKKKQKKLSKKTVEIDTNKQIKIRLCREKERILKKTQIDCITSIVDKRKVFSVQLITTKTTKFYESKLIVEYNIEEGDLFKFP